MTGLVPMTHVTVEVFFIFCRKQWDFYRVHVWEIQVFPTAREAIRTFHVEAWYRNQTKLESTALSGIFLFWKDCNGKRNEQREHIYQHLDIPRTSKRLPKSWEVDCLIKKEKYTSCNKGDLKRNKPPPPLVSAALHRAPQRQGFLTEQCHQALHQWKHKGKRADVQKNWGSCFLLTQPNSPSAYYVTFCSVLHSLLLWWRDATLLGRKGLWAQGLKINQPLLFWKQSIKRILL